MTEIICPNCGKSSSLDGDGPACECPYCCEEMPRQITGLTLVYQINQQRIEIPALARTILGRDALGANVFSNILFNGKQVISRTHCSIEFRENKFHLQDEGSLNGTFYGPDKINCKNSTQVIEDGSLIFLGEEPFLAKLKVEPNKSHIEETKIEANQTIFVRKYRCNESFCGHEVEQPPNICPKCGTFNSFVQIPG